MKLRKKLIEVALPLEAINKAAAREKSIRHGHPSTLHLWWARRPLAAARAVIFAQMVDDPSAWPDLFPTEKAQEKERKRLFKIIEDLVLWENTTNERVLETVRNEIWASWRRTCAENADDLRAKELFDRHRLPAFHDPFAGGGALPLEAQRLGLESYASDLNPVAVLINKAMIEIPPKFSGRPAVNPEWRRTSAGEKTLRQWTGAQGLAEDVRYYGKWMRDEAEKRIGHLYPKVRVTQEMIDGLPGKPDTTRPDLKPYLNRELTVIAWLWARTVKSPNPAFADVDVPLVSTFTLATKPGKEAYVQPIIEGNNYRFTVRTDTPDDADAVINGTKIGGRGANFRCILSNAPISGDYIKEEGKSGRMGSRLMAIVAEGDRGRVYLAPMPDHESIASSAIPTWRPEGDIATRMTGGNCTPYGLKSWGDLFTSRQLLALTTFSDLVGEARLKAVVDAIASGLADDSISLTNGGSHVRAYAEAISVYLGLSASKAADNNSTICSWMPGIKYEVTRNTFSRQAIPMSWDYAEANPFASSSGDFFEQVKRALTVFEISFATTAIGGAATQEDAQIGISSVDRVVSTDPPYYDNISYADLSDFFYVWLRRSMKEVFPGLFSTVVVPKVEELIASPYRHGSKEEAEGFFLNGMTRAMHRLADQAHAAFPVTIYYAFKQSETEDNGTGDTTSTGWDTFLEAVIRAGFSITGTWPMRTERSARSVGIGSNALASSIILVCRPLSSGAPTVSRRDFVQALEAELAPALRKLQEGNIAPVDLAQAAIGPGMAVYTRYAKVLDAEGNSLTVKQALALINEKLDTVLAEQEGDFDADTRWALAWFEQVGFSEGEYGLAETLSKAKNTSVQGMVDAGAVKSGAGKVRLLRPEELPADWSPETDARLTEWEIVHQLIRVLNTGGETGAAELVAKLGSRADTARELAYRLYVLCERKKRAQEAIAYNALVQSWPEIQRLASERETRPTEPVQTTMFS
jgi:putative DNA methylase